jgi:hypothetical protein
VTAVVRWRGGVLNLKLGIRFRTVTLDFVKENDEKTRLNFQN